MSKLREEQKCQGLPSQNEVTKQLWEEASQRSTVARVGSALNRPLLGGNLRQLAALSRHLCGPAEERYRPYLLGSNPGPGSFLPAENSRHWSARTKRMSPYLPGYANWATENLDPIVPAAENKHDQFVRNDLIYYCYLNFVLNGWFLAPDQCILHWRSALHVFKILLYLLLLNHWPPFSHLGVVGTEQDQGKMTDTITHASPAWSAALY